MRSTLRIPHSASTEEGRCALRTSILGRVDKDENGCWNWTGAKTRAGYGRWNLTHVGLGQLAHRISYAAFVGDIPAGLTLDHLCRNRGCVNPEHLEPVTQGENALRGDTLAARHAAKTACAQGHPYDESNTYHHGGRRHCRACRSAIWRRYRERLAA